MQEEYNETVNIPSDTGLWKVEVRNNTNATDTYSLAVYIYVNTSIWITTNHTSVTLNATNTSDVQINLAVPNTTMNGTYEGYLQYLDRNNVGIRVPFTVDVTTPMLVVNNTMNLATFTTDENYGVNLTRVLYFNVSNQGFYNLSVNFTDSGNLSCYSGSCSEYNASFTYNTTSSIAANNFAIINVNITFNSSLPKNTIYSGWIYINAINTNSNLTSHPYSGFNITLRLNLTDLLDVRVRNIMSNDWSDNIISNSSVNETATIALNVYYINGTEITDLSLSNFTSVWLQERNVTDSTGRIPSTGNLSFYAATTPFYCTISCPSWGGNNHYYINATVPANRPGGYYTVHVIANSTRNPIYGGEGANQTLVINNTGLKLTAITSTSFYFYEGGSAQYLNISVINYGLISPGGNITIDNWSNATITADSANSSCYAAISPSGGRTFTFDSTTSGDTIDPNGTEACVFSWKIVPASSVTSDTSVNNLKILATDANFSDIENIYILVQDNTTTGTTTVPSSSTSGTSGTTSNATSTISGTSNYLGIIDYPKNISIEQGGSKKVEVTVKNTNNTLTQNMMISVSGINSSWYTVSPSSPVKLKRGESKTFEVTFNIPSNASIGDYSAKFNGTSIYINPVRPDISFIYDTVLKSFTLKITPGEAFKSEINSKLSQYKNEMNSLEGQINQSKSKDYNTSEAESLFDQLKTKVNQASNYITNNDYTSAYSLFSQIDSLINQTKSSLASLSSITGNVAGIKGNWWDWGKWVIIVVVVIVAALFAYMLWPTKIETKPSVAVVQQEITERKDKITETFDKLRERLKKIRKEAKE
jgi:hypothetical protein